VFSVTTSEQFLRQARKFFKKHPDLKSRFATVFAALKEASSSRENCRCLWFAGFGAKGSSITPSALFSRKTVKRYARR
jgi:hypothetical protein